MLRLTLTGEAASQPIVTRLARELGIDIALLGGQIDSIGTLPFALLYVGVPAGAWAEGPLRARLEDAGATTEVVGLFDWISPAIVDLIIGSTLETLYMVAIAALIGTLAGLPLGIFLAPAAGGELFEAVAVNRVLGLVVNATRSTPFIILVVALSPSPDSSPAPRSAPGGHRAALAGGHALHRPHRRGGDPRGRSGAGGSLAGDGRDAAADRAKSADTRSTSGPRARRHLGHRQPALELRHGRAVGGGGLGDLGIRYGYQRFMRK